MSVPSPRKRRRSSSSLNCINNELNEDSNHELELKAFINSVDGAYRQSNCASTSVVEFDNYADHCLLQQLENCQNPNSISSADITPAPDISPVSNHRNSPNIENPTPISIKEYPLEYDVTISSTPDPYSDVPYSEVPNTHVDQFDGKQLRFYPEGIPKFPYCPFYSLFSGLTLWRESLLGQSLIEALGDLVLDDVINRDMSRHLLEVFDEVRS